MYNARHERCKIFRIPYKNFMCNFHISFKNLIKTNRKGVGSISLCSIYFSLYISTNEKSNSNKKNRNNNHFLMHCYGCGSSGDVIRCAPSEEKKEKKIKVQKNYVIEMTFIWRVMRFEVSLRKSFFAVFVIIFPCCFSMFLMRTWRVFWWKGKLLWMLLKGWKM